MIVCLYLEMSNFAKGKIYKKVGTGFASSYKNYLKALALNRVKVTADPRANYDILHINIPYLASLNYILKAKLKSKKVVISSHATAEDFQGVLKISHLLYPLAVKYYKFAYDLADAVVSPSEYTKSLLIKYGVDKNKIFVVSNGVDLRKFKNKRKKINQKKRCLTIINVANAIPRKGTYTFATLGGLFPNCQYRWYGKIFKSALFPSLPKTIPQNVRFCGYAPDIIAAYKEGDIFFFPSYEENQGMVILEAAAMGLPIVIRDLPVYRGWLKNNINCLIGKNDRELKKQLQRLIKSPALRKKLSNGALKLAKENDLKETGQLLKKIYKSLLVSKK